MMNSSSDSFGSGGGVGHSNNISSSHSSSTSGGVRQSLFRNLNANCETTFKTIEGLRVGTTKNSSSLLKCNDIFFTVPWQASAPGTLAIRRNDSYGRFNDGQSRMISAHSAALTDFEFYPFRNDLLASSGMDSLTKFWLIPSDYATSKDNNNAQITTPHFTINHQSSSPAVRLHFHNMVDHLLFTAHQNKVVSLWDVNQINGSTTESPLLSIPAERHNDLIESMSVSHDGSMLVTCSRDRFMRFFDPRAGTNELFVTMAHNSAKGFRSVWMGNNNYLFTCGFNLSKREFSIFDTRKMCNHIVEHGTSGNVSSNVKPIVTQYIDDASSLLSPFYVEANSVMFLCGKGDRNIRYYEMEQLKGDIDACKPYYIGEHQSQNSQQAIWPIPRHAVNVKSCEVARFLRLNGQNVIETLSFVVPRKSQHLFQEDLYTNEPDRRTPVVDVTTWAAGNDGYNPSIVSMRPEDMVSVLEVSVTEGGKLEIIDTNSEQTESSEYASDSEDNNIIIDDTAIEPAKIQVAHRLRSGAVTNANGSETVITPRTRARAVLISPMVTQISGTERRTRKRINTVIHKAPFIEVSGSKIQRRIRSNSQHPLAMVNKMRQQQATFSSYLVKRNPSGIGWKKRWFTIDHNIYYFENSQSAEALGKISIDEIVSVSRSNKRENSFRIELLSGRNMYLASDTKLLCEDWLHRIRSAMSPFNQFESKSEKKEEFALSGYLKKLGTLGHWKRRYFDYSSEDHILTYSSKKGKDALGSIRLDKITAITQLTEDDKQAKKYSLCFKIETMTRTHILQAETEEDYSLWVNTLHKEIEFVRSLEVSSAMHSSEQVENLHKNLRGNLIRLSNGTLKKRWLYYSENHSSLYIFTSKQAEEYFFLNGYITDRSQLELIIPIHDVVDVRYLPEEYAQTYNISPKELVYYFVIETRSQGSIILLTRSVTQKCNWIDALMTIRDSVSSSNTQVQDQVTRVDSKPAAKNSPSLLEQLGIKNLNEKPSADLVMLDLSKLRKGVQLMLICIKGKEGRIFEVELAAKSLNSSQCFILDAGTVIYQWNGRNTNRLEKSKAFEVAYTIKVLERGGMADVHIIDDGAQQNDDMKRYSDAFWKILGGNVSIIGTEIHQTPETKIYRISPSSDPKQILTAVTYKKSERPSKDILNSKNVYVLDAATELFVWIGKGSTQQQRNLGLVVACKLQKRPNRKCSARVTKLFESSENILWKEKFASYETFLPLHQDVQVSKASSKQDLIQILEHPLCAKPPADSFNVTQLRVWRVDENEIKEELPETMHGIFYTEEAYIVLVKCTENSEERIISYYWQGRDVLKQKSTGAVLSLSIDEELDGKAEQIVVNQNKEPAEFLELFQARMIVHLGSHDSVKEAMCLYEIRGESLCDVRAIEIEANVKRLNSMHCFLLRAEDKLYVWQGTGSNIFERQGAQCLADLFKSKDSTVWSIINQSEGSEDGDFRSYIGLMGYMRIEDAKANRSQPRLLVCSSTRVFHIEEVHPFSQNDLNKDFCYILLPYQCHGKVFTWLGKTAPNTLKRYTLFKTQEVITHLNSKQATSKNVGVVVTPGSEPLEFISNFRGWNSPATSSTRGRRKSTILRKVVSTNAKQVLLEEVLKQYSEQVYTYKRLLTDPLPKNVDTTKLEQYLDDEEFQTLFEMTKAEFYQKPLTKQQEWKKKLYLLQAV